jgi:hypothetical protein
MSNRIRIALIIIPLITLTAFSQSKETKRTLSNDLEKQVVGLLQDTSQDVLKLQSPKNRLTYSIEIANLLWKYDEKEALALYRRAMSDMRQNLLQMETDSNLPENFDFVVIEDPSREKADSNLVGIGKPSISEKQPVKKLDYDFVRKFETAIKLREYLIESMAKTAPFLAEEFLNETTQIVRNEEFKVSLNYQNKSLERIVALGIGKVDSNKSLEMGRKFLLRSDLRGMTEFLSEFHKIDSSKTVILVDEYLKKLELREAGYADLIVELEAANERTKISSEKSPLIKDGRIKEAIESIVQSIANQANYKNPWVFISLMQLFEKYVPSIATQIRQKYLNDKNPAVVQLFKSNAIETLSAKSKSTTPSNENDRKENEAGNRKLSDTEKKELLDELRIELNQSKQSEKPELLFDAAKTLASAGEKELAIGLLEEVQTYASRKIRNSDDVELFANLVNIYSTAQPEKSFELLESTIPRLQELLEAFIDVIPFLEPGGDEELENGECECNLIKSVLSNSPANDEAILNLANSDFLRLKGLVYKFNRPEVQIALKILIIHSLLDQTSR